jgi:hypothetical protein
MQIMGGSTRVYLEENSILWLHGDLEKKQENKTHRAKVKEEDGKADMRGWLYIPRTMQRQILLEAHYATAGGHSGAD